MQTEFPTGPTDVTTAPLAPRRPRVEWVGSLTTTPLADVLHRIASEERSGDLQINLGSTIKYIYFDHGFVVFSASNLKRDRLGESLIEAGRISRHEFALVSMLMKSSKRKFGQTLVQAGVMSEEELGKQVAAQVNRIVMSLFKVKDAVYSFDERDNIIPLNLMVSLSIYRILLEGIRSMSDGKLILSGLPPLQTSVRVSERPPFTIEPRKLKPIEQEVLKSAGRGARLSTLIRGEKSERGLALRACYGLYSAGLLEPVEPGARKPLKIQEETGVFVLSDIEQKFADTPGTNARQEILLEFDRLDRASEKDLLALSGPPKEESIREAFASRQAEWQQKRELVEAQHTLVTKVDVIQERLRRAYEVMLEKQQSETRAPDRPDYLTAEVDAEAFLPPKREAPPPLSDDLFEETPDFATDDTMASMAGMSDPASSDELSAADFELVEIGDGEDGAEALPLMSSSPDDGSQTAPVETEGALEEAAAGSESGDEAAAGVQAEPESERDDARDEDEDAEHVEDERSRAGGSASQLQGSARADRVRQLLRDVKLHFQVRDWEHAVSLLFELVELDPGEAKHHGMLARAMARHPVMRKDAERHFIEALRLAPQDADLHYSLGLYYKSFGMHARAQIEFRTALRIRPQHEGARKHLSGGGKGNKDPLRDMFRKIFG